MLCKSLSLLILLLLPLNSGSAQTPNLGAILDRPESYQKQFVADFLKDGAATGFVEGYPQTTNHYDDFRFLLTNKEWVMPMAEIRIIEWLKEPELNKKMIETVAGTIAFSGTIQSLDFTARIFGNLPEFHRFIRMALYSKPANNKTNFITKYYYALESKVPLIRAVAEETLSERMDLPPSLFPFWVEAMIDRYGHEPTTLEILRDPLVEFARLHGRENPEELRQRLASDSKEAYARRQQSGGKKPR